MSERYVAVIADVVGSRNLAIGEQKLSDDAEALINRLNAKFESALVSKFEITGGDEFKALLKTPSVVPDVIWTIHTTFSTASVRFGIGYGTLTTSISDRVGKLNGPVFHHARTAIEKAHAAGRKNRKAEELGGVFEGFPKDYDQILSDWGTVIRHIFSKLTAQQQLIFSKLYEQSLLPKTKQKTQRSLAEDLSTQYQTITNQKSAGGWFAFESGMRGWRLSLQQAVRLQELLDQGYSEQSLAS